MGKKKVNKYLVPILGIGILAATVLGSKALGLWVSTGNELVDKKAATGTLITEDIKGWMTFQQVSEMFKVPLDEMYRGLNLPANTPPETKLKDLEASVPGFEPDVVREWLDKRNGGTGTEAVSTPATQEAPAQAETKPVAPASAPAPAAVPVQSGTKAPTPAAANPAPAQAPVSAAKPQTAERPAGEEPPALTDQSTSNDIRGSMTIAQVCKAFSISPAVLKEKLGLPANLSDQRDFRSIREEFDVEVTAVRQVVAELTGK